MKKEAGSSAGRRPRARAGRAGQTARRPARDCAGQEEQGARCRENILSRRGIVFPLQEPPSSTFLRWLRQEAAAGEAMPGDSLKGGAAGPVMALAAVGRREGV
jgi:hypothetical protein